MCDFPLNHLLVAQYKILSDQKLHFGKLYWQCVAIHIVGLIAVFAVFEDVVLRWLGETLVMIGFATILMGFIIHRLRNLEIQYETLLSNIEEELLKAGNLGVQRMPKSGRFGARFITNMAIYLLGICLAVSGLAFF